MNQLQLPEFISADMEEFDVHFHSECSPALVALLKVGEMSNH
jgi:hypothetical protein